MGYSRHALRLVEDILARRDNSGQIHVLELGAQEINYDVLPSAIFRFIYRLNPRFFGNLMKYFRLLPGLFAAPIFSAANIHYACIDLFDADGVVQLDLKSRSASFGTSWQVRPRDQPGRDRAYFQSDACV